MAAYLLLALAIVAEVSGTISLKLSEGFSKLGPSLVVVAGYAIALGALSVVLKMGIPVGVAYAVWAAVGVAAVALIGVLFLDERFNLTMIGGLLLVIGGVVLIEVGSAQ
ncbi:SMR family transporter [Amycolatopsis acidiphila]|uniref:QacE family quaternary ammonium compound efflux SMR transporter n=1 Tax=Amycolatopsis acidiphila TaxID=715473 RepID=A0A558AGV2_9PSEU|nr:SMR family transporter [Amycolatopsis acidiphila]TVT23456.1 QacE family quaternary ammonium compound efflux SMR transporter [Amycolatopsis acidiphila]UIJ59912.1 SMR family transporter [Amycolatopsis acidiphila]GHG62479.1 QacE family quaternary ammonium compound efflux SMR transporter [Amycolatopsis acidiphila]